MPLLIIYTILTIFFALNLTMDTQAKGAAWPLSFLLYAVIWPFVVMRKIWVVFSNTFRRF